MRRVCDASDVANFGYGDDEVHPCTQPATHRGWADDAWYPVPGGRERVHLCADHAADVYDVRMYRYRTVTR